jgi:hypothetical protein
VLSRASERSDRGGAIEPGMPGVWRLPAGRSTARPSSTLPGLRRVPGDARAQPVRHPRIAHAADVLLLECGALIGARSGSARSREY